MIRRARKKRTKSEILGLFDSIIAEWFSSKYNTLTEPQEFGIPLIHSGKNVLVSSPTGSGKTLTAFISIINELFLMAKKGTLEDNIYCVYISPLKALANDIHKNLELPLAEIKELANKENIKVPRIRVGVRSGDTATSERQKMLRKPPHIFITTPESLALSLTAPKFREKFKTVRYVIVDEIHELANNKRGVMLSLNLERLSNLAGNFQRIGLSATQAPLDEIARFLVGYQGEKERDVWIVESSLRKDLDLKVITPVDDLTLTPYEVATEKMYDALVKMINEHRTTLIFTNTRSGTEHVAYKLKERGIDKLEAHHGSLSKETRLRVEKDLKEGNLKCVISSTSLELGIDIGYIDLVVQIGSPKSVAKGLQRIGRSGHAYGKVAKGRFFVFELDDLVECTTLVKCAYEGKIDRITIPKNSLDVLAQVIVGMSLEQRWSVEEAYELIKNSYCYHELPLEKFEEVLNYLGGHVLGDSFYSKIWYDPEGRIFGRKRSSRMIFFMNLGTIPDEADYLVVDVEGKRLGDLSEKFVEKLQRGDVFILGARSYEVIKITGSRVVVRDASGKRPTVPSWAGEMLPRSFDLSTEVGRFRELVKNSIETLGVEKTVELLKKEYYLDERGAKSIVSYFSEQMHYTVPTDKELLIEGYKDPSGRYNIIFHYPFGRRVNDALSRAYGYKITEQYHVNVGISVTDDAFMITSKKNIPLSRINNLLSSEGIESILKDAIFNTELFKQRFRHVATRSFMVLRRYKGKSISVARQQLRSDKILKLLRDIPNFPVMDETFNEILNLAMDLPHAVKVLEDIESGAIKINIRDYTDAPSIFAHSIILVGISDIVLIEDRSALLKELHLKLLEKIIPAEEIGEAFSEEDLRTYFSSKFRIKTEAELLEFVSKAPGVDILHRRGINVFDYADIPLDDLRSIIEQLVNSEKLVSVYTTRLLWTVPALYPVFSTIYARECDGPLDWTGEKELEELAKEKKLKKGEVLEKLKCMERAYLAGRKVLGAKTYWYRRDRVEINRDYALELLIRNLLYFKAPLTFEELIYTLHVDEESTRRVLKYMVDEGTVMKSEFLVGYGEQYMLREDYIALKKSQGITFEQMMRYRATKILKPMNCREYFSRFLVVFNVDSLKVRNCYEEFKELVMQGEVVYGRFMGHRNCYTLKSMLPIFVGAYQAVELDEKAARILRLISALGDSATLQKIVNMSNYKQREVKKILRILEENLYIYREVKNLSNVNRDIDEYLYKLTHTTIKDNKYELIKKVISGYGPLTKSQVEWYTSLEFEINEGIKKTMVEGATYYHVENIKDTEFIHTVVIPREDPYTYPMLNIVYDMFKDVKTHILVKNAKLSGTGEVEQRCDHAFVTEIEGNIDEFLQALGATSIVISTVPSKSKELQKVGGFYLSESLSNKIFSKRQVLSYLLWKNRLATGRKLKTPQEVVNFILFAHSDFEMIRAYRNIALDKYFKSELIYEITDMNGERAYATLDTAAMLQAIKSKSISKNAQILYRLFKEQRKLKLGELARDSPLGIERTNRALIELMDGNYVAHYPSGYIIVNSQYSRAQAKKKMIKKIVDMFGFFSLDFIENFTGQYIPCHEVTDILNGMSMRKGVYLNNGTLYYALENEINNVEYFDEPVVLEQKDPLARLIRSIYPQKLDGFLVIKGEFLGTVKASIKRKIKIKKSTSEEAETIFKEFISTLIH